MDLTGWFLITQFSILLLATRSSVAAAQSHQINQMQSTKYENGQDRSLEFPDELLPSTSDILLPSPLSKLPTSRPSMLLIGTIDGTLTAFNEDSLDLGRPVWTLDTSPGALLSSSLSKIELVRDGAKIQLIPSLDGSLFSFDGEKIEPLPVSADTLLSSSFKVSEDSVITGGKETRIYGLDVQTGKIKYACAANGCNTFRRDVDEEVQGTETLVVSRLSQTIRAFNIHLGNENWNFSVGSLDITLAASKRPRSGIISDQQDCLRLSDESEDIEATSFRFDVATGTVFAVSADGNNQLWQYQFKDPITSAWILKNGCVRPLTLVTSVPPFFDPAVVDQNRQLIYIGQFDDQLYIQRASKLSYPPMINRFPHVTFRPLLISAPSRTPAIAAAYRPFLKSLSESSPSADSKALVPVRSDQYPFDNGYFLAAEDPLSFCSDGKSRVASDDDVEESIFDRLLRWGKVSGLILVPVLIGAGMTWLCRSRPLALESHPDNGIKRQNTTSTTGSTTKSLSSVLSLQELGPKISRFRSDFEVLEQLGKGGFGVVYAAKNRLDDNIYAVKKIQLPRSDAAREKVRREVRVLAKLDHVGIVRFYNAWVETSDVEPSSGVPSHSPIDSVRGRGDAFELMSQSSCTSADLFTDWIGTCRRRRHSRNDNLRRSLTGTAHSRQEKDESVDIVFEKDTNALSEPSVNPGLEGWMDLSSDPSGGHSLLEERSKIVDDLDDFTSSSYEGAAWTDQATANSPTDPQPWKFGPNSPVRPDPPNGKFFATPQDRKRSHSSTTKKSTPSLSGLSDLDSSSNDNLDDNQAELQNSPSRSKPQLFIQMELCRKETLKDWLRLNNETRNRHHILDIFYQIVGAVEYIHSRGLMHRDLKPSNVLFSLEGTAVKIADFGLVTATDDEDARLAIMSDNMFSLNGGHTNQVGTSLYMSPELMMGKSYNEKIDVYSLGLIFFELLSPFTTEMERIVNITEAKKFNFSIDSRRVLDGDRVRLWTRKGDEDLLRRLLALQPDERPSATHLRNFGSLFGELLLAYDENGRSRGQSFAVPNIFQGN